MYVNSTAKTWMIRLFIFCLAVILSACGSGFEGNQSHLYSDSGTTGATDPLGHPYTSGGDPRVQDAKNEMAPKDPSAPTEAEKRNMDFARKVGAPQFLRFDQNGNLRQQGRSSFRLKLQAHGQILTFEGSFQVVGPQTLAIEKISAKENPVYAISAVITDKPDGSSEAEVYLTHTLARPNQTTKGNDTTSDNLSTEQAKLLYRSYEGQVRLRENHGTQISDNENPSLHQQIDSLKRIKQARVQNWVVALGPSYYQVDVLTPEKRDMDDSDQTRAKQKNKTFSEGREAPPSARVAFSFSGEAKRTNQVESHPSLRVKNGKQAPSDVRLFGDAETEDLRSFVVTLQDPDKKTQTDLIMEVDGLRESESKLRNESHGLNGLSANSFLSSPYNDPNHPRTTEAIEDFEQNWSLKEVQSWMSRLRSERKRDVKNFFRYSHPFRRLIESIYEFHDVPAQTIYLNFLESSYFYGGQYDNDQSPSGSSALGPFQFLHGTAESLGMRVYKASSQYDERRYFIPAACGAAQYMEDLIEDFIVSDATLAIMAYHLGPGGGAAAIHCSYGITSQSAQKACGRKVAKGKFKGSEYQKFFRQMKNYRFSFRDISRQNLIGDDKIDYVSKFLALYFLAGDPEANGVAPESYENKLPRSTLLPPKPLKNKECERAIESIKTLLYPSA